jgi:hypothetical protein
LTATRHEDVAAVGGLYGEGAIAVLLGELPKRGVCLCHRPHLLASLTGRATVQSTPREALQVAGGHANSRKVRGLLTEPFQAIPMLKKTASLGLASATVGAHAAAGSAEWAYSHGSTRRHRGSRLGRCAVPLQSILEGTPW